ncbi:hypothetical protein NQZ68_033117 [Dissostichus eleginoides]|nr:hypothetical protein NQZ68_033117 [Dissostichus eleginoides]
MAIRSSDDGVSYLDTISINTNISPPPPRPHTQEDHGTSDHQPVTEETETQPAANQTLRKV